MDITDEADLDRIAQAPAIGSKIDLTPRAWPGIGSSRATASWRISTVSQACIAQLDGAVPRWRTPPAA